MIIENKTFDEERALYGSSGLTLVGCRFSGPADGESALKESRDITAEHCVFDLRYPCWHNNGLVITDSLMTEKCRAPVWYSENIRLSDTEIHCIKALRECRNVEISGCEIVSEEFGWSSVGVSMENSSAVSEYFMLRAEGLRFTGVEMRGKYSFQYIKNAEFDNCRFGTKDAFWHCENVIVRNSTVNGEYLAWYSDGLTLENCRITGTQPFCYCRNLKLIGCEMTDTDLCFEKSEVTADIISPVVSVKNPASGVISAPAVGELIMDDPRAKANVIITGASR